MTADQARFWLIAGSLSLTAATFGFLATAPSFGYPLLFRDAMRLIEIALPVLLGYLGAAAQFVFHNMAGHAKSGIPGDATNPLLGLMVKGPLTVFTAVIIGLITAFGYSNRSTSHISGMSVDDLAAALTGALGILSVTINTAVAYLFSLQNKPLKG